MNIPNQDNEKEPLQNQQVKNEQVQNQDIGVEVEDEYLDRDQQQPPNQHQEQNIQEQQHPIRQKTPLKRWESYYQAKQSPSKLVRFCHSWYKFRDKVARPFNYKLPFFRRSAGMVILMILIFAAIVPMSYGKVFASDSDERVEVATFPPVIFLLLAFVFSTRNSIPGFLLGISYENQLVLHKFFSYMSVITGWFHGIDELLNSHHSISNWRHINGLVLCSSMSVLVIKGVLFKWMQTFFNTFLGLHWLFFVIVLVFAVIHGAALATIVGGGAFLLDLILRVYLINRYKKLTKKCQIQKVANRVVEISFVKQGEKFHYDPGQYAFLTIPELSNFAMHPFSMQSCPYEEKVSFYIKNIGTFTERIRKLAEQKNEIEVKVHGPYGYPQVEIENDKFQYFVFFSGGIGVTAMQSYAKNLLYEHQMGRPLKRIIFCWTGREPDFLEHIVNVRKFDKQLQDDEQFEHESVLQMVAHVTTKNLDPEVLAKYRSSVDHEIIEGRMNIKDIIIRAQKEAANMGLKRIAVLSCGPHSMLSRVNMMASTLSGKNKIKIDYHRETFSFLTEII